MAAQIKVRALACCCLQGGPKIMPYNLIKY